MSPRPYHLGQRQVAVDQTRARILAAASALLADPAGVAAFTIDAIARQAGVSRMTVYYQYGSKRGLLEALFDFLAAQGGMDQLASAFRRPDPLEALAEFIATFCRFWASNRLILHRLQALAVLDPEIEQASRARQERRREGLRVLIGRLAERQPLERPDELIDVLHTLTSFQTFDALADQGRGLEQVIALLDRLARAILNLYRR
jgi:AcrR family transcriptional regulator